MYVCDTISVGENTARERKSCVQHLTAAKDWMRRAQRGGIPLRIRQNSQTPNSGQTVRWVWRGLNMRSGVKVGRLISSPTFPTGGAVKMSTNNHGRRKIGSGFSETCRSNEAENPDKRLK